MKSSAYKCFEFGRRLLGPPSPDFSTLPTEKIFKIKQSLCGFTSNKNDQFWFFLGLKETILLYEDRFQNEPSLDVNLDFCERRHQKC